ncbi:MAG: carboxypeptidase-like regulatory domain-containing protein, partial [Capsulimonadaceae bacterium]
RWSLYRTTATATALGYETKTANITVTANATTNNSMGLTETPGTISGTVTDSLTNTALSGVTVTATAGSISKSATTASNGTYSMSVEPGIYTVSVTPPSGYNQPSPATDTATIEFPAGTTPFTASFALPPQQGTLDGIVTSNGTPLAGAVVTITPLNSSASTVSPVTTTSGATTNFSVPVNEGKYSVAVSAAGYSSPPAQSPITIEPGVVLTPPVTFALTTAVLSGLVTDKYSGNSIPPSGSTAPVATVTATGSTNVATSTTTTAESGGQNYVMNLAPDTYTVSASAPGYQSASQANVVLTAGGEQVSFALEPLNVFETPGWNFISTPVGYAAASTLFGSAPVEYWSPGTLSYTSATSLALGQGYWVNLANKVEDNFPGTAPTGSDQTVDLYYGWNMIGVPSMSAIDVDALTFTTTATNATPVPFLNAATANPPMIGSTLYGYTPGAAAYTSIVAGGQLAPWQGYWIFDAVPDPAPTTANPNPYSLTLTLPTNSGASTPALK